MTPGDVNDVTLLIVSVDMTERRGINRTGEETPVTYLAAESATNVRLVSMRIPRHELGFWERRVIVRGGEQWMDDAITLCELRK